ncbi:MAG: ATP-binding response regulator [Gemmatirosa sp.]
MGVDDPARAARGDGTGAPTAGPTPREVRSLAPEHAHHGSEAVAPAAPRLDAEGPVRPSILLVDDRSENLLALEAILEPLPVRTVRATSAAEALAHVDEERFAVILLDVQMPGTDGLETARLIKVRERGRVVPILFITAQDRDRRGMTTAYEAGAVDYLFKPLDPDELRAKVAAFLALDRMHAEDRDRRRRYSDRLVSTSEERYRQAAESAERARAALEVADQSKTEFLSRMSHELRTPLNAILGYIQILDLGILGSITPEQHTHLNRVRQSAVHLLHLVNEILDLVTLETARLRVVHEVGHVGDVCEAALTLVRIEAALRNLSVIGLPAGERGAAYVGDPDRVRQVLVHLLTNALKFTAPGGRVAVSCGTTSGVGAEAGEELDPDPDAPGPGPWAYVRITDTGMGIAPDQLARIFEAFTQIDGGHTRVEGGTGLGLTISRRLARAMGGEVTVRSAPGEGAAFTLWLRTPDALNPAASDEPPGAPSPSSAAMLEGAVADAATRTPVVGAARGSREPLSPTTYQAIATLGMAIAARIEPIARAHAARLQDDASLPNVKTLPEAQLRNHMSTLVNEVAQVLIVTGETQARAPELLRDSSEILRLVSELHGAQRQRLGWNEAHIAREVDLLHAEVVATLGREAAAGSADGDALAQAMVLVHRLLEQSCQASLRGLRVAQQVHTT